MAISYKYKIQPEKKGDKVKTPSIPITLKGMNTTPIEIVALIDSGADVSVIPQGLAEFLNLDLTKGKNIAHGVGGVVNVVNTILNVSLGKNHENYNFNIPVQVILGPDEIPPLLGRKGFFDKFKITFDNKKAQVTLKQITKSFF